MLPALGKIQKLEVGDQDTASVLLLVEFRVSSEESFV